MFQSWSEIEWPSSIIPHPVLIAYFLIILPCALTTVSESAVQNFEFTGYRLQQYDVSENFYGSSISLKIISAVKNYCHFLGSRQSVVNCEAAAQLTASKSLRKCLIITWQDVLDMYPNLETTINDSHGAIIIIIPKSFRGLADKQKNVGRFLMAFYFYQQ